MHPRNICIIKLPSALVLISELLDYRFGVGVVEGEESLTKSVTKKTKEFLYVFTSTGLKKSVSQTDNILFFPDIVNSLFGVFLQTQTQSSRSAYQTHKKRSLINFCSEPESTIE